MFLFRLGWNFFGLPLPFLDEMFHQVYRLFYQILVDQSTYALMLVPLIVGWSALQLYSLRCDGYEVVECLVEKVIYIYIYIKEGYYTVG